MAVSHLLVACLIILKFATASPYIAGQGNFIAAPMIRYFTMPESCKNDGKSFCFSQEDYPSEIIDNLLKDITTLEVENNDFEESSNCYSNRQGDSFQENDCPSKFTNNLIYYIVDEFDNDRVVVQSEGRFQQRFSVTWCLEEGRLNHATTYFSNETVQEYEMSCQNQYINYDFLVLSQKPDFYGNYKLEMARTKSGIPICCACKYVKKNK